MGFPNILYTLVPCAYFCRCICGRGLNTLGGLLLLLLTSTLKSLTSASATLGRVTLIGAVLVGFSKLDNTPIALMMLLSVNGISRFCFDFIAAVNSSSAFVAQLATAFSGKSNFDGMNTYVSVCQFSLVHGI